MHNALKQSKLNLMPTLLTIGKPKFPQIHWCLPLDLTTPLYTNFITTYSWSPLKLLEGLNNWLLILCGPYSHSTEPRKHTLRTYIALRMSMSMATT